MRPQINGEGRIGIEPRACLRSGSVNSIHHHKVLQLRDTVTEGNPENPALSSSPSDRRRLFDEAVLPTEFLQRFLACQAALVFHSEQVAANTLHPVYDEKPTNQDL
jgi:hypothetical protein